uniref:Regulatory protein NPR central domain-containing protein n=1 Tax=Ananas comosus var. bracteatus TaxID=296719 RepID=A0A6V7PRH9_ANACO|nr:unnamed protein product [Ananas comosus var. bracteatus]
MVAVAVAVAVVVVVQKQLAAMVEKASIEDVMKVLLASRKQELHQLWAACSHLVAKSGLPAEVLAKHLPIDIVARIEELRLSSSLRHHHHHHQHHQHHQHQRRRSAASSPSSSSPFIASLAGPSVDLDAADQHHHKMRRMRRALDSSDVELVKLMVMGEGLNLDEALALHYAVENCSREVAKALLELGAADVNRPAGPAGKTPLHVAAEMVDPDMVAVLLDHHADPTARTVDGVTPLDVLRNLTSDFLFKGAVPGLSHVEPNKLRLCLELVQSAAMVMSREEAAAAGGGGGGGVGAADPNSAAIYPPMDDAETSGLDSRMVYLNLGMAAAAAAQLGCKMSSEGEENESSSSRSQGRGMNIGPPSMFSSLGFLNLPY